MIVRCRLCQRVEGDSLLIYFQKLQSCCCWYLLCVHRITSYVEISHAAWKVLVLVLNKKSELMLIGRATASVEFRTQVVLVYLQYISAKIHSQCALQPKIAKKSLKTHMLGVQGRSRSSMLVPPESSSAVLAMIRSKSVSICNRFHARWANSGEITISKGDPCLMPSFEGNLLTQWHQIIS